MINEILTATGLPFRKTRFTKPPKGTYAVYMDDVENDGPDGINAIRTHDYTVELYSPTPDDEAEEKLESILDERGVRWSKQDRTWIQSEQLYQTVYDFQYIEKRRIK